MTTERDVQRLVWSLLHASMTRDMVGHGALLEALDVDQARAVAGTYAFLLAALVAADAAPVDPAALIRERLLDLAHDLPDPPGFP